MDFIEQVKEKVKKHGPLNIVLPEYQEERMYHAAEKLLKEGLVKKVLFTGDKEFIKKKAKDAKANIDGVQIIPLDKSEYFDDFVKTYSDIRKIKGITEEQAREAMKNELYFGAMLVKKGMADGMVAGAMNTTGDVVRSAIRVIGTCKGIDTVSSFFIMIVPDSPYGEKGLLFFADAGVVIDPSESQLADIAICTADSMESLIGSKPKVAFLSFSTKGSARHPRADKMINALKLARQKRKDIIMDGELQGDAALEERVGRKKAPDSKVAGQANVLIFPDLDAGNIAYKLVQYLGKAQAFGPILQGLARPVNDLSRGCVVDDIIGVVCITQLQAIGSKN